MSPLHNLLLLWSGKDIELELLVWTFIWEGREKQKALASQRLLSLKLCSCVSTTISMTGEGSTWFWSMPPGGSSTRSCRRAELLMSSEQPRSGRVGTWGTGRGLEAGGCHLQPEVSPCLTVCHWPPRSWRSWQMLWRTAMQRRWFTETSSQRICSWGSGVSWRLLTSAGRCMPPPWGMVGQKASSGYEAIQNKTTSDLVTQRHFGLFSCKYIDTAISFQK